MWAEHDDRGPAADLLHVLMTIDSNHAQQKLNKAS